MESTYCRNIKENREKMYKKVVLCMVKRDLNLPVNEFLEIENEGNHWLRAAKEVLPSYKFKRIHKKYCKKLCDYLEKSEFLLMKTPELYSLTHLVD